MNHFATILHVICVYIISNLTNYSLSFIVDAKVPDIINAMFMCGFD